MAWQDRIKEAAYTSPSGVRTVLFYENVSQLVDKKANIFIFPDQDGAFVQDLGRGPRRFPLTLFFFGTDYDTAAAAFTVSLEEKGIGKLEHPIYGEFSVIPLSIERRDNLKTGANQAIFRVEFVETIAAAVPGGTVDSVSTVEALSESVAETAPVTFLQQLLLDLPGGITAARGAMTSALSRSRTFISPLAALSTDITADYLAIDTSIVAGISATEFDPVTVASQYYRLITLPAEGNAPTANKVVAYTDFTESVTESEFAESIFSPLPQSQFAADSLAGSIGITALALSTSRADDLRTRGQSVTLSESLALTSTAVTDWQDNQRESLNILDTGETYQKRQALVALESGRLVNESFNLAIEKSIVTDRPRAPLEVSGPLGSSLDESFDALIVQNNLGGRDIIEVPRDKRLVFVS